MFGTLFGKAGENKKYNIMKTILKITLIGLAVLTFNNAFSQGAVMKGKMNKEGVAATPATDKVPAVEKQEVTTPAGAAQQKSETVVQQAEPATVKQSRINTPLKGAKPVMKKQDVAREKKISDTNAK